MVERMAPQKEGEMSGWALPLTNLHPRKYRGGKCSPPRPIATVRDADGNVLLQAVGEPYRSNAEAVKLAGDLCAAMNSMPPEKPNCPKPAQRQGGNLDSSTGWEETCRKCMDGDIEPMHCEYYGEPNGCNSPIYGEHPKAPSSGNAAAMRRTLLRFLVWAQQDLWEHAWYGQSSGNYKQLLDAMVKEISEALSEPPRQCDVGTAEEQEERFTKVCTANSRDGVRGLCSATCPFSRDYQSECALAWGQTPYAEEQRGETDGGE